MCAPRHVCDESNAFYYDDYGRQRYLEEEYMMHGICYWTTNTKSAQRKNLKKIAPLRGKSMQFMHLGANDYRSYYYYMLGEQGFSVHITENEEILIGAPGIYQWIGSVIRYNANSPLYSWQNQVEYSSDIPNPRYFSDYDNIYFGYAVSSGYFNVNSQRKLLYLASAPHSSQQQGAVHIFDIIDYSHMEQMIKVHHTFHGQQYGEYFGYTLITDDFDSDKLIDVAIGAPYNSKNGTHENGAVYIYKNRGDSSNFKLHAILQTEYEFSGRFGTTISKIGDINQDGYNGSRIYNLETIFLRLQ